MATEQDTQNTGSTGETPGQEPKDQQQQATPETGGNGQQQQESKPQEPTRLPDDHPLVKAYGSTRDKLSQATSELTELRAKSAKVTQLETELDKRPTQEAVDTLQTRYDRLEAFVLATGLGKALDSRTFTKALFETDTDIKDLVKDWNRADPTATSQALASTGGGEGKPKHDPNELLRIAAGKQ